MANRSKKDDKRVWRGFFNYQMSGEEKKRARILADDSERIPALEYISEMAKAGYKVSVSLNESASTFTCGVTGNQGTPNQGYTFVLSHVDAGVAVVGAWFVIAEVFQWGVWPVEDVAAPNW